VPERQFDFDATAESLLAGHPRRRPGRKVLINAHKNGFLYVLDRTTEGRSRSNLTSRSTGPRTSISRLPPGPDRPLERAMKGETVNVFPSRGTNATPDRFQSETGLVYPNS